MADRDTRSLREIMLSIEEHARNTDEKLAGDEGLQAVPKRCATHAMQIKSQWFHVRALWAGLLGAMSALGICKLFKLF